MIYILIGIWMSSGKAAVAIEFNDLKSCQAAAAEIHRHDNYGGPRALFCAAKGKAP